MEKKKIVLSDKEEGRDYLVTNVKKTRFSIKFIDISLASFWVLGAGLLAFCTLHMGINYHDTNRIVLGSILAAIALIMLIFIPFIVKAKSLKKIGTVYPLTLTIFELTVGIVITYQRLSNGWGFLSRNLWLSPVMHLSMGVMALIALILYCQKSKDYSPRFMMAAFALSIPPMLAMMKINSYNYFGYVGEFVANPNAYLGWWFGMLYVIGTCFLMLAVVANVLGVGVRLLDRGDNTATIERQIVEVEKPVEVIRPVHARPRRGLLIIKSPEDKYNLPKDKKGK